MKRILSIMLFASMLLTLTACGAKEASDVSTTEKSIPFEARYIRTGYCADGRKYPLIFWITNCTELEDYCSSGGYVFKDELKNYDDEFFKNHNLIFVFIEEGSGSITHEVTDVLLTPSDRENRYAIQPVIDRMTPEVQTCDMAQWHIIIEVGKKYGKHNTDLKKPSIVQVAQ